MANRTLIGQTANSFNNTANWSGATVPVTGDVIFIPDGSYVITADVASATHGVEYCTINVGPNFTGQMGSTASPLQMGNTGGHTDLNYNAPGCTNFHLNADIGAAQIVDTHSTLGCVTLQAPTGKHIDAFYAYGGTGTKLVDCAGTYTLVITDGSGAQVTVENLSVTATAIRALSGIIKVTGAVTTSTAHDGIIELLGNAKTYAAVYSEGDGGRIRFKGPGSTITNSTIYRGWGLANLGVVPITFTNTIVVHSAGHFRAGSHCIWSGTPDCTAWGGADVRGIPDVTVKTLGTIGPA